jgi:membrane protein YqaA with SNARE-associated domain
MFLVFGWGFAEAIFFFVVADVAITLITARSGLLAGLNASLFATLGALFGGIIVYFWAGIDVEAIDRMFDWVPAISPGLIEAVRKETADNWEVAAFIGGFTGTPYKLYAAAAGDQAINLRALMGITVIARFSRFFAGALLAHGLTWILNRLGQGRWAVPLIVLFWIGFYAWYWTAMPW